jgi:hypothetical protein
LAQHFAQIFESGSQASLPLFSPERGETDWQNFVKGVASCADEANTNMAIPCLQNAGTEEIFAGLSAAAAETMVRLTWGPVLDGLGVGVVCTRPVRETAVHFRDKQG